MASLSKKSRGSPMVDINVTPMVDVLLVLLIIFMITVPKPTNNISIDLPQPTKDQHPPKNPPSPLKLKITQGGQLYLNDVPVSQSDLKLQLEVYAAKPVDRQPELRINANDNASYDIVAKVLADAKDVGMEKIGFVNTDLGD